MIYKVFDLFACVHNEMQLMYILFLACGSKEGDFVKRGVGIIRLILNFRLSASCSRSHSDIRNLNLIGKTSVYFLHCFSSFFAFVATFFILRFDSKNVTMLLQ